MQSKQSPYKPIFRETFNSEQSVRENGGVATAVTFSNGKGVFNGTSSKVAYSFPTNGVYTVRMKLKFNSLGITQYLFDTRPSAGFPSYYVYINTLNSIIGNIGVNYVNGVAGNTVSTNTREVVISGIPLTSYLFQVGLYLAGGGFFLNAEVDLLEIYQGTLTASEVKNLYDNDWNREVTGLNGQVSGIELITNIADRELSSDTGFWLVGTNCSISDGVAHAINAPTTSANTILKRAGMNFTIGKTYRISYTIKNYVSGGVSLGGFNYYEPTRNANGTYTSNIVVDAQGFYLYIRANGTTLDIDDISIIETNPTLLLDFDSTRGQLIDKTGKNTLTPTDVNIKKIGSNYSAEFNATTSKIDCGSDFIGTKAVTICGWINADSFGEDNAGRLFDNGNFSLFISNLSGFYTDQLVLFSSLSTTPGSRATSANKAISLGKHIFICATRKLDGKGTLYLGDLKSAPTITSTADQATGTPVVGTTNVFMGNRTSNDRTFDGNIPILKVYEGILDLETITQIWSETKKHIK